MAAGLNLREQLQPLTKMALIDRCAGLRPGPVTSVGPRSWSPRSLFGADTDAEMLIVAGDNIDWVSSEPAWARLCASRPSPPRPA